MAPGDLVHSNQVELLFDPSLREEEEPMHVVAFASGSGTNFEQAILESQQCRKFSIDLLLTDIEKKKGAETKIRALGFADQYKVPAVTVNGYQMCGSWKEAQKTVEGRGEYESKSHRFNGILLDEVSQFEREHSLQFDLAILAGYMRLFKGPLLRRFHHRAINVHPADLLTLTDQGTRKYIGENAVYDALKAGERKTRSSIILVDPQIDAGAILVSGPWLAYAGKEDITQDEADKHQTAQKKASDWPALRFALRAIARSELGLHKRKFHPDGNPVVVYQGKEMSYEGVVLDRSV